MIERYSRKIMRDIWSEKSKFDAYLTVEILACEAWSKLGDIPFEDVEIIKKNAKYDISRIKQIEKETKHDIVAFTRSVSESLKEEKKWIHYGLTSTDVVDTAYGYLYKKANFILLEDIEKLMSVLAKKAIKYKYTPMMGRTHGVHAEITTFGLVFLLWYEEFNRNLKRFQDACSDVETGKISGAVGTFANISPYIQDYVCENLEINSSKISTQVLQRDRHAHYFATIALIGSSIEKIATEIRHLQRTEVREVEEYFSDGQKGSSAMPHKRNPISSENLCGCSRVLRGYMLSSYENINLWHERDISHSSAERIIAPDATMLLDYMLVRLIDILDNLTVFEENMMNNIYITHGVIFSQRFILKLVEKGYSREKAYDIVQPCAIKSWNDKINFREIVEKEPLIRDVLNQEDIDDCFDMKYQLKNVDEIYKRVGL